MSFMNIFRRKPSLPNLQCKNGNPFYYSRLVIVRGFNSTYVFKCVNSERDLFYVDNTRQVRGVLSGVLSGHAKRGGVVVEQIGRSSGSYYS